MTDSALCGNCCSCGQSYQSGLINLETLSGRTRRFIAPKRACDLLQALGLSPEDGVTIMHRITEVEYIGDDTLQAGDFILVSSKLEKSALREKAIEAGIGEAHSAEETEPQACSHAKERTVQEAKEEVVVHETQKILQNIQFTMEPVPDCLLGVTNKKVTVKSHAAVDINVPNALQVGYSLLLCISYFSKWHVFEEGDTVYDCMLNQTNIINNNNKFYVIQLLESESGGTYAVWNRWGRGLLLKMHSLFNIRSW